MALNPKLSTSGLRQECLSFPETLAQSIAGIAPVAMPAVTIPLVFANAGKGTWFAFLVATVGLVLVSLNINQFARRSASSGALYAYVARSLGPTTGFITGWALLLAYLGTVMTVLCGFAIYLNIVLGAFGYHASPILLFAACAGVSWFYAYTDIQLSTVIMLVFEFTSVCLSLILAVLVISKHGFSIDTSQLSLEGVSSQGIGLGLVLAIWAFVGFESATALGDETKSPLQFIPWAVIWSLVLTGFFFILLSYTEVLGFSGYKTTLDKTDVPLSVLAELAGVEWLGILLSVGVTFSFFTASLAMLTAGARVVFTMARHGLFPSAAGRTHKKNETPYVAVSFSALLVFVVPATLSLLGIQVLDIYGYLGTIATYGFLLAYILISVAAPVYLSQQGRLRSGNVAIAVMATLFMLIPVVGSVYPVPPAPYNLFPYLFLIYLAIGGCLFWRLRRRFPQLVEGMERDLEASHKRFSDRY